MRESGIKLLLFRPREMWSFPVHCDLYAPMERRFADDCNCFKG